MAHNSLSPADVMLAGRLGVLIRKQNPMTQRMATAAMTPLTAATMSGVLEGGVVSSKGDGGRAWIEDGDSIFVTAKGE